MTAAFRSFGRSPLGAFQRSPLGVRDDADGTLAAVVAGEWDSWSGVVSASGADYDAGTATWRAADFPAPTPVVSRILTFSGRTFAATSNAGVKELFGVASSPRWQPVSGLSTGNVSDLEVMGGALHAAKRSPDGNPITDPLRRFNPVTETWDVVTLPAAWGGIDAMAPSEDGLELFLCREFLTAVEGGTVASPRFGVWDGVTLLEGGSGAGIPTGQIGSAAVVGSQRFFVLASGTELVYEWVGGNVLQTLGGMYRQFKSSFFEGGAQTVAQIGGELYCGGIFRAKTADGVVPLKGFARRDPGEWVEVDGGVQRLSASANVYAIEPFPGGALVAGDMDQAGAVTGARGLYRWASASGWSKYENSTGIDSASSAFSVSVAGTL